MTEEIKNAITNTNTKTNNYNFNSFNSFNNFNFKFNKNVIKNNKETEKEKEVLLKKEEAKEIELEEEEEKEEEEDNSNNEEEYEEDNEEEEEEYIEEEEIDEEESFKLKCAEEFKKRFDYLSGDLITCLPPKKEKEDKIEEVEDEDEDDDELGVEFKEKYNNALNEKEEKERLEKERINNELDLMFIVDCTGSMGSWIEATKNELYNIINNIKDDHPKASVRISFVGYRDFKDHNRFEILDFTNDVDVAKQFIKKVCATGGDDFPEDVAGGLAKALEQSWRSKAKFCVMVTDAPPHGKKYQTFKSGFTDNYPNGHPSDIPIEETIKKFADLNIVFSGIEIANNTTVMFQIISNIYFKKTGQHISLGKLGSNVKEFGKFVSEGASSTLSLTNGTSLSGLKSQNSNNHMGKIFGELQKRYKTIKTKSLKTLSNEEKNLAKMFERLSNEFDMLYEEHNRNEVEDKKKVEIFPGRGFIVNDYKSYSSVSLLNIKDLKHQDKDKLKFDIYKAYESKVAPTFKSNLKHMTSRKAIAHYWYIDELDSNNIDWKNPCIKSDLTYTEVKIDQSPFSQGEMRYAFYVYDIIYDMPLVGKLPKKLPIENNNLNYFSKDIISIVICQKIARFFNERIIYFLPSTEFTLDFVNTYVYELSTYNIVTQSFNKTLYWIENIIPGKYEKYNNNAGWDQGEDCSEISKIAQAFSHFSWQITQGYMLIVDLQGVDGYLTDPQIHCLDRKKFGKGNLGYIGIMKFFLTHKCNKYCEKLKLIHPQRKINLQSDEQAFSEVCDFYTKKFKQEVKGRISSKNCEICKLKYWSFDEIVEKTKEEKEKEFFDNNYNKKIHFCFKCESLGAKTGFVKCLKCDVNFPYPDYLIASGKNPVICKKCDMERIMKIRENNDKKIMRFERRVKMRKEKEAKEAKKAKEGKEGKEGKKTKQTKEGDVIDDGLVVGIGFFNNSFYNLNKKFKEIEYFDLYLDEEIENISLNENQDEEEEEENEFDFNEEDDDIDSGYVYKGLIGSGNFIDKKNNMKNKKKSEDCGTGKIKGNSENKKEKVKYYYKEKEKKEEEKKEGLNDDEKESLNEKDSEEDKDNKENNNKEKKKKRDGVTIVLQKHNEKEEKEEKEEDINNEKNVILIKEDFKKLFQ